MSWFRILLAYLSISASLVLAGTAPAPIANTNQCIRDLGGLSVCQSRGTLGLPSDLQGCCDGLRQLAIDRCSCNPAIDSILGPEGKQAYNLEAICRIAQPFKWLNVTAFASHSCDSVQSHKYGCEKSDIAIDGERMANIQTFGSLFEHAADESICFNTPAFASSIGKVFKPDVTFTVPYGIGTYVGTENVAEYLGMSFSSLTHGFWWNDTTPDTTKKGRLEVSEDGTLWTSGSTSNGSFLHGLLPYKGQYFEQEIQFEGCNTLVSNYKVHPSEGLQFLVESIVQTADLSSRWGVEDICRYHTKYCADDSETRQYESEQACLDYLSKLPLYTNKCGSNRALSGHSISCKFKHHFMIPANPKMHCAHIGQAGKADMNGHMKCDDEAECSQDEGQDTWPPISGIGDKTPDDRKKVFEETNKDSIKEPYGCAVPSTDHGQHGS